MLPPPPARIADLGCGTGTLTRLLVDEGYVVDGIDISPEMISRARAKVPEADFRVGDAATPGLEEAAYDVVLCRHVLWAMPDPVTAFATWVDLLAPDGVVVLVEGRWGTGAGLTASAAEAIVLTARAGHGPAPARGRVLGQGDLTTRGTPHEPQVTPRRRRIPDRNG